MTTKFKIGLDYGGTKVEGILLNENGEEMKRKRYNYNQDYLSGVEVIKNLVNEFDQFADMQCTVGLGIPGSSSNETGLVKNANAIWLNNQPFQKDLEKILKRDIRIMNDANCFTLSEAVDGAGSKYKSVFGIIIGSGLGSGLSFNKTIIEGVNQVAGDWGHQPLPYPTQDELEVNVDCQVVNCKRPLCAERFLSGKGFAENFNKKYKTNLSSKEITELELNGDDRAQKELSLYEDRLARIIAVMIGIFDPEAIVLGGGMSNIERLYINIPKLIPKYAFSDKVRNKVLKNKHGDSSGVRGAAWLWN
jgi:fructokinase|tara:strand:- start:27 stop:941 length:915 start_codon:yes stop_codon:yes gene_type:complete